LLEISSIIVSGGAGFVVANALLNPGPYLRRDALSTQGHSAIRMTIGCVPALILAGCIEAFISPSHAPIWFKAGLGVVFGVVFWLYLLGKATVSNRDQV
jgi:uncharacterized membrane protein SpoIIM required for sporulation